MKYFIALCLAAGCTFPEELMAQRRPSAPPAEPQPVAEPEYKPPDFPYFGTEEELPYLPSEAPPRLVGPNQYQRPRDPLPSSQSWMLPEWPRFYGIPRPYSIFPLYPQYQMYPWWGW